MEFLQYVVDNIFAFTFCGTFGIVGGILVAFIAITVILYLLALLVGVCMVTLSCLACLIVKIYLVLRKLFCPA